MDLCAPPTTNQHEAQKSQPNSKEIQQLCTSFCFFFPFVALNLLSIIRHNSYLYSPKNVYVDFKGRKKLHNLTFFSTHLTCEH